MSEIGIKTDDITANPAMTASIHPLLHQNTSNLSEQRFSSTFTGREFFFVHMCATDHVVNGQRILPGVAYLEMARAAVEQAAGVVEVGQVIRMKNVVWARPIAVGEQPVQVHTGVFPEANGEISYEIYSETEAAAGPVVHSQGRVIPVPESKMPTLDLKTIQAHCSQRTFSAAEVYEAFQAMGIDYGPGHRGIEAVYAAPEQILVKLKLPASLSGTEDQFILHPIMMDSALQASIGFRLGTGDTNPDGGKADLKPFLPFALEELEVLGKCTSPMWALITGKLPKLNLDLCDEQGNVRVRLKGYTSRILGESSPAEVPEMPGTLMLEPGWRESEIIPEETLPGYGQHLVILCELGIETQISGVAPVSRCLSLQSQPQGAKRQDTAYQDTTCQRIDQRFQSYAVRVFEELQSILKDGATGRVLIQIVVSTQEEQQLFNGLSGLLKTARLENPKLTGQIIGVEPGEATRRNHRETERECAYRRGPLSNGYSNKVSRRSTNGGRLA